MERYTGSQYDDDLTVGMDEYDDSLQTGDVDLFEYVGDEESPITRLKTIILSIDWEITDDILRQFNIELLDLKDIWANDKIKLVYIQALEKISKYIYKEKANSNPNAIKLLLTFYTNLEKIVSNESMPEEEKKALLMADVEKFEKLKKQISRLPTKPEPEPEPEQTTTTKPFKTAPYFRMDEPLPSDEAEDPLLNLKAIVFGMDWEITEEDLVNLGEEVRRLEKLYANSKAKLIFLQGIGALGAYINLKRSNAHADAFKLLHSFFLSLENCVRNALTGDDEKKILMPEVEKFNAFKSIIASTISPEAIAASEEDLKKDSEDGDSDAYEAIAPAFADMPEDMHGFQEEDEAITIEGDVKQKMEGQIDNFFEDEKQEKDFADRLTGRAPKKNGLVEEMESRLDRFFGDEEEQRMMKTSAEVALQGVDVETEADDESGEEALPRHKGELAPALSDENFAGSTFGDQVLDEESAAELPEEEEPPPAVSPAPEEITAVMGGVQVESEADDDSEEEPLPMAGEELAPALFSVEEELKEEETEVPYEGESLSGIEDRLDRFFAEEPEQPLFAAGTEEMELLGVDTGTDEEGDEEALSSFTEDTSPGVYPAEEIEEETLPTIEKEDQPGIAEEEPVGALSSDHEEEIITGDIEAPVVETAEEIPALEEEEEALVFEDEEALSYAEEEEPELTLDEDFEIAPEEETELTLDEDFEIAPEEEPELTLDEDFEITSEEEPEVSLEEKGETAPEVETAPTTLEEEVSSEAEEHEFAAFSMEEDMLLPEEESMQKVEEEVPSALEGEALPEFEEASAIFEEEEISQEEELPVEFEDHLKEVFEEEATEFEFVEEEEIASGTSEEITGEEMSPEVAFSEAERTAQEAVVPESTAEEMVLEPGEDKAVETGAEKKETETELLFEEEDFGFLEEKEEASFAEATEEDVVDSKSAELQELGDVVEYIEGVEFDSDIESEMGLEPAAESEEVVFKPAGKEELAEKEPAEEITFGEVEAELDRFFSEQSKDGAQAEETGKDEEFGQKIEEGFGDSEIQMEVFPEPDRFAEIPAGGKLESLFAEGESEEEEVVFTAAEDLEGEGEDQLASLRDYVASLGLEINDSILDNLQSEINKLHDLWFTKPVEKIFLQLMSTVSEHIGHYRDKASPEAHDLLMSIFNKLELARLTGSDSVEIQEGLLAETSKILLWQQKLISDKSFEQGEDFSSIFEATDEGAEGDLTAQKSDGNQFKNDMASPLKFSQEELDALKITKIVRDELEVMRKSFKEEMGELLRQHLEKNISGKEE